MKPLLSTVILVGLAASLAFSTAGCSSKWSKARHLKQARQYYAAGEYDKAEIEYMNVLQLESMNPDAISGLGLIYFDESRVSRVYAFLMKARELQPSNLEVRTRLATVLLTAGRKAEARDEALFVLQQRPNDSEAPVLLAEASGQLRDITDARARIQGLPGDVSRSAPALVALGILDLLQQDGNSAEGNFERAKAVDPKCSAAYLGLTTIYRTRHDNARAEKAFAAAAANSSIRSGTQIQYAQFEIQTGHPDVGRRILEGVVQKAPDCLPPYLVLADLSAGDRKYDDALSLVGKVLGRDPGNPEALSLSARIKLAKGETDKAIADLERAISLYPNSPQLLYQLGVASASAGDMAKASSALAGAVKAAPDFAPATMAWAEVNVRQGNLNAAITALQSLIQKHPEIPEAGLALANVYLRRGGLDEAIATYRQLAQHFPRNPQIPVLTGLVLVQQDKRTEARRDFEHALEIDPMFVGALEQLADLDMRDRDFKTALNRVKAYIARDPKAPAAYLVLAKIYAAQGDRISAEATLKQVIALKPDQALPYMMLAQLYIATNEQNKAISNLEAAFKANEKNPEPLMMIAVIHDQQKEYTAARDYYEKVLTIDPRFSAALNNLAYLYSEYLNNLDRAFDLAQRARTLLPGEPHTADTLGWILYKRGQYPWALSLLLESAERLPDSADVQFHLGMTHYMLGDEPSAHAALTHALKLDPTISGAVPAKEALATLDLDPTTATPAVVATLERTISSHPDPVAYVRLGEIYEHRGDDTKALTAYTAALKLSPNHVGAALGMVHVYHRQNQTAKALELAKATRKLAPTNPDVAQALGELALETGDSAWAMSLLQEAVRAHPSDTETLYAYGRAAYGAGQLSTAEDSLRSALNQQAAFGSASAARDYLAMVVASADGNAATQSLDTIQRLLRTDPTFIPALMASGMYKEHARDFAGAKADYSHILDRWPTFSPARRRLAILLADDGSDDNQAFDLASKARQAYPNDPELAKAFGLILYRQGNYLRASNMLEESARARTDDGELMFYLGMAQNELKNQAESIRSLRRAMELNLNPDLAAKARAILARSK